MSTEYWTVRRWLAETTPLPSFKSALPYCACFALHFDSPDFYEVGLRVVL